MRNRETRMGNRTAKFVSALIGGIIAGVPLAAVSQTAPNAPATASADADCLASPKGAAPQGQHWYYRLERTTKRQCWYLRAEGGKVTQAAQATTDAPTTDPAPSQQQTVQDARAEYLTPRSGVTSRTSNAVAQATASTPAQQTPDQATDSSPQQPAVATPWPDVSTAVAPPTPQPAPITAAAPPSAKPAKPPAPMALAAADSTADRPVGSLQMLLLVIGGALALAGLLASVIYRLARRRVRVQVAERRGRWDDWGMQDQDESRAPWLGATPDARPRPVDFDEARPQQTAQLAAFTREISRIAAQSAAVRSEAAELDEADIFDGAFEIEAAPRLAARKTGAEKPVARDEDHRDENVQIEDAVDVDVITAMLERLATQGPRLPQPSPEAALANLARNQRGQSAARA
ncbi:hypothetical protein [Bradyrhizobium symbiodeficiens]|uniref:hypothetical protein n=1 Tax=Bradyrhizobium symbiodeficiens TaxID=1404367 RepID=UPI000BA196B4|nr:hypothetical protein [Bradyrhizobium symbiodeficiens]AWM07153.1 hypothetical protein CIT39_12295 [Bradyrhizobium symbiodeficiens]